MKRLADNIHHVLWSFIFSDVRDFGRGIARAAGGWARFICLYRCFLWVCVEDLCTRQSMFIALMSSI